MKLEEIQKKIRPILQEHGIKRASVFGSVARGDERTNSDVDLLVELGPGPMGMFKYMEFIRKLENSLDKKVDLVTEGNVNRHLEPYIRPDLKKIYEE